jgi:hypothetical protein
LERDESLLATARSWDLSPIPSELLHPTDTDPDTADTDTDTDTAHFGAAPTATDPGGSSVGVEVCSLRQLLPLCGYDRPFDDVAGDRTLARLVLIARGDELAARVVLQRLLAGIVAIALRRAPIVSGGANAAANELVAAAWEVIRRYPIERRAERVAGNMLRDIEYRAFVRERRRHRRSEVPLPDYDIALGMACAVYDDLDPGARHEWSQVLDWARRRGVERVHIELLEELAVGASCDDLAPLRQCTPRTIRNHRRRAVEEVRRAYDLLAA